MAYRFFIPDSSERKNTITPADIAAGRLRISDNNKYHFPSKDCKIKIAYNNKTYVCDFKLNPDAKDRSYTIINKELIDDLAITTNSILECERTGEKTYNMSK